MAAKSGSPVIMYYGAGWPTNIGNAFIDFGAMAIIQAAAPEARVVFASEMPRWLFGDKDASKALDIASVTCCDLAVFSGMAMCEEFVRVNGPTILKLRERGVPVLLLGTGGLEYNQKEKELYSDFLRAVNPVAFISRDQQSYEAYRDVVPQSIAGIDCGFFLSKSYTPAAVDLPPYIVANFDDPRIRMPDLTGLGYSVVYTHHECFGKIPRGRKQRPQTMISDIPQDYFTLYASAECVYSDRVHACVAALSYGRKAQLFHPTPRGGLFEAVGAKDIRTAPISLDPVDFEARRQKMQEAATGVIRETLGNFLR